MSINPGVTRCPDTSRASQAESGGMSRATDAIRPVWMATSIRSDRPWAGPTTTPFLITRSYICLIAPVPLRPLCLLPRQPRRGLLECHSAAAAEELRASPLRQIARLDVRLAAGGMDEDVPDRAAGAPQFPVNPATNTHGVTSA